MWGPPGITDIMALRAVVLVSALLCEMVARPGAQSPPDALPSAQILSPERDSYATGVVLLRAAADASAPVQTVTFFVDGHQVCILDRPPFECEWDAGQDVKAHQVRAVFALDRKSVV